MNLREQTEKDLSFTLEGADWGLPVELIDPDGNKSSTSRQDKTFIMKVVSFRTSNLVS